MRSFVPAARGPDPGSIPGEGGEVLGGAGVGTSSEVRRNPL